MCQLMFQEFWLEEIHLQRKSPVNITLAYVVILLVNLNYKLIVAGLSVACILVVCQTND
jgi:hypothetical protein